MRRSLILLVPVLFGCKGDEKVVSRVVLPPGVERPKGLQPDPPPPTPLSPPATKIERSPDPSSNKGTPVALSLGTPSTPGIEGVCRYEEAGVGCWDSSGVANAKLTREVGAVLASERTKVTLPVSVGRKVRAAVALVPSDPTGGSDAWYADAVHPLETPLALNLANAPDGRRRTFVLLGETRKTLTSSILFTERKRLPREVSINLKVGASGMLNGHKLTVSKVEKMSESDEARFFVRYRPAWRVVLLSSGGPHDESEFFPVDPYPVRLADGRRASFNSLAKGKVHFAPKDAPNVQPIYYSELPQGAVAVLLDRDPAKVKRLTFGGYTVQRTTMSGIPLDPR